MRAACVCVRFRVTPLEKVTLFSRAPSDSISLRYCTAKCYGFVVMRRPTTTGMKTWSRDDYGAQAFRTTASDGPQWQSIGKRIPTDLNAGEVLEELAVNP